jgi:hypothetical protein
MALSVLWFSAIALEGVLLTRGAQVGLLKHYKMFFFYLGLVLARDVCLLPVYFWSPKFYGRVYWGSELTVVFAGCFLVWEVYKIAFTPYPGAARVGRSALLLLFIFAITQIFMSILNSPTWTLGRTTLETERDLRVAQGVLLVGLVALFGYYAVPLGRNLGGIIYGYSLFVATAVANLTVRNYLGNGFQAAWQYIQPCCYLFVLSLWCWTLWTFAPVPKPESDPHMEEDYQTLLQATRRKLSLGRARMLRGIRR